MKESHFFAVPYFITYFRFIEDRIIKIVFLFGILYYNRYQRLLCGFGNHMYMRFTLPNFKYYYISFAFIVYLVLFLCISENHKNHLLYGCGYTQIFFLRPFDLTVWYIWSLQLIFHSIGLDWCNEHKTQKEQLKPMALSIHWIKKYNTLSCHKQETKKNFCYFATELY